MALPPFPPPPKNPFVPFFIVTGGMFFAFLSGFSVCLFDLDKVGECVTYVEGWVDKFRALGDHLIAWGIKFMQTVIAHSQKS